MPPRRRWVVVAALALWLLLVAYHSLLQSSRSFDPGIRTTSIGSRQAVTWVQPAGPAWDAGVRPGDVVAAIDGRPPPANSAEPLATGQQVELRSAARGQLMLILEPSPLLRSMVQRTAFLLIAACFAVLGGVVFLLSPLPRQATAFLALSGTSATGLIAALATPYGSAWALALVYVALLGAGLSAVGLALECPTGRLASLYGRRWLLVILAASACLVGLYVWVVFVDSARYALLQHLWLGLGSLDLLSACALVANAAMRPTSDQAHARRGIRLVALACIAGLAPFCLLAIGPDALGLGYVLSPEVAIISVVLVPLGMAACILGDYIPGLERLAQRGLVAALVWIVLLAGYTIGLGLARRTLTSAFNLSPVAVVWLAVNIALVTLTFPLLQGRLRATLERRMFRDVYGYAEVLRTMTREIARLGGSDAVAYGTLARLGRILDLLWAAIVLRDDADAHPNGYCWGSPLRPLDTDLVIRQLEETLSRPMGAESPRAVGTCDEAWLVPLLVDKGAIGALLVGPKRRRRELSGTDLSLVVALAPVLAVALENGMLVRRLRTHVDILGTRERELAALSARLLQVQEEERHRLALDLHDEPLQRAILLARELHEPPSAARRAHWRRSAEEIADSLRAISTGLRPPVLDDFGLVAALERLVRDVRTRTDVEASLQLLPADCPPVCRLERELEVALYRIAQEALNNCLKHAAASDVWITLELANEQLQLRIADDGRGYVAVVEEAGQETPGLGLLGMRERLRPWHGHVDVRAGPAGGTEVVAEVALASAR